MSQKKSIGPDQRLYLEWLDATAALVAEGKDNKAIRTALFELLDSRVSGCNKQGTACSKTVTALTRTWSIVNLEIVDLRDRAITLLPDLTSHPPAGV